uniref:PH domain-containing protein n=1 Tax=Hyaloperonospora arabidopsidis (strain Emoy2) TaxID=559515 RepID=M4BA99_HYAAE
MAGFVRVEMDGEKQRKRSLSASSPCSVATSEGRASANPKVFSRWLYGVLRGDTLVLYWRRTDYKRKTAPLDTLQLQMQAAAANESVFGFDHECLYVRVKASGRVVALRIHERKEIVRWVTALYYQSIDTSNVHEDGKTEETRKRSQQHARPAVVSTRRKRVSFQEEPKVHVLPQEVYDPADLFYSENDYEQFLLERPSQLSSLMSTIYAKTAAKLRVSRKR